MVDHIYSFLQQAAVYKAGRSSKPLTFQDWAGVPSTATSGLDLIVTTLPASLCLVAVPAMHDLKSSHLGNSKKAAGDNEFRTRT